ncbi:hypothetical protein [Mycobacterium dioxanotrophicus]|uniref:hypothetical protein n=1 Tax=Mycobacterium dioxanotrophicus TaxID=482462 RepID=UPI0018DF3114|nr:hypothetical protein [Mycobacterium dioxanotrophicus]
MAVGNTRPGVATVANVARFSGSATPPAKIGTAMTVSVVETTEPTIGKVRSSGPTSSTGMVASHPISPPNGNL